MICLPEMEMMRHKAFNQLDDFIREHEKSKMQLEAQKQQLMQQELELRKREALNESEKRKIQLQKEMVKKWHTENYLIFFCKRESRDDTLWVSKILQLFLLKMFNIILSDLKEFELFEHIQCGQHRLSANTCLPDNMVTGINSNTRSVDVF